MRTLKIPAKSGLVDVTWDHLRAAKKLFYSQQQALLNLMREKQLSVADFAGNSESFTSHGGREHLAAIAADGLHYLLLRFRFGKEDHAAAASGAAHFSSQSAVAGGHLDELFNQGRGDAGRIGLAQLPFLADQAGHFIPVRHSKSLVQGSGNRADALKILEDAS